MSLQNKVIIVTGTSNGIGLALSKHLLASGARVLGIDIQPLPEAAISSSSSFAFHQCNLTKPTVADEVVALAQSKFGGQIDGLANVAGIMDNGGSVDTLEDDEWDRVIAINLTAPVKLMRAVVKAMRAQGKGGAIVNVSSKAGSSGAVSGCAYTASKHGLLGATKNVAWRFNDEGIRCNAIAPGAVGTNIMANSHSNGMAGLDQGGLAKSGPVTMLITGQDYSKIMAPEDMAPAIAFLLSDGSKMISGTVLPVDRAWCTI